MWVCVISKAKACAWCSTFLMTCLNLWIRQSKNNQNKTHHTVFVKNMLLTFFCISIYLSPLNCYTSLSTHSLLPSSVMQDGKASIYWRCTEYLLTTLHCTWYGTRNVRTHYNHTKLLLEFQVCVIQKLFLYSYKMYWGNFIG